MGIKETAYEFYSAIHGRRLVAEGYGQTSEELRKRIRTRSPFQIVQVVRHVELAIIHHDLTERGYRKVPSRRSL